MEAPEDKGVKQVLLDRIRAREIHAGITIDG
jgi:hypothetical protein